MSSMSEIRDMVNAARTSKDAVAVTGNQDYRITPIYHARLESIEGELKLMNRHLAALVNVLSAATSYLGSPYPDEG